MVLLLYYIHASVVKLLDKIPIFFSGNGSAWNTTSGSASMLHAAQT